MLSSLVMPVFGVVVGGGVGDLIIGVVDGIGVTGDVDVGVIVVVVVGVVVYGCVGVVVGFTSWVLLLVLVLLSLVLVLLSVFAFVALVSLVLLFVV